MAFFTIMPGLDWLWSALEIQSPPKVWAFTTTTVFLVLMMGFSLCTYNQQTLKDRIEECAQAKARLETAILRMRRSSKKS
jgi:C4-dicarboxylate-specific signal transduction histidine kinase